MTPDDIAAYLRAQQRLIVVSNGPHGFPHPVPMNFGIDDRERLLILTFAKSQKVRNLERDPRASLLVESGTIYHEIKSVIVYARAEIIRDRDEILANRALFASKTQTVTQGTPEMARQISDSMVKRVIVRFTPERYVSWDHSKLAGKY